jgi:hypothetical protein
MSFKDAKKIFERFLEREKERNIQMLEVSRLLGVDFTFSNEEMIRQAEEAFVMHMEQEVQRMVEGIFDGRS